MSDYPLRTLGFGLLALGVLQLFPVDVSAPPDSGPLVIEDAQVAAIVDRACADCHTNHPDWPWYAGVAPASWLLARHVREAREELNFSTWGDLAVRRRFSKLGEVIDNVESGDMPLPSYTWGHPDARLSEEDRQALVNWAHEMRSQLRTASGRADAPGRSGGNLP